MFMFKYEKFADSKKRSNVKESFLGCLNEEKRIAKKQIVRLPCVICGEQNTVMHHVKHVRKVLQKKNPNSFNYYLEVMRLTNRKTIPVCPYHHKLIHSGKYDGVSLKNTFERVMPYYEENIKPLLFSNKNILISAHGNSLRALCKKLLNISDKKIIDFEIGTGNPMLLTFGENLEVKKYKYLDDKRAKNILFNV